MSTINDALALHQHHRQACNIPDRTIFCHDNLEILQGINTECIDLIYLDPPFNKKKVFTAPIGTSAEGASFKDIFTLEDIKDEWVQTIKEDHYALYRLLESVKDIEGRTSYNFCYLAYMTIRLLECHRILKDTGSIYLHCDPTMSHYLKLLMDCVFSERNFRNEIIWSYPASPSNTTKDFPRKHDVLLRYTKGTDFIFNTKDVSIPYSDSSVNRVKYGAYASKVMQGTKIKLKGAGKLPTSVWQDIQQSYRYRKEITGYPTQKPLALLERIIAASSNEGDMVLDPFCGCATTCVAAQKAHRQWIGIDISIKAYELVQKRLNAEVWNDPNALQRHTGKIPEVHCYTDPPKRTDGNYTTQQKKYIYILSHRNYPHEYKVGIASNIKSRLTAYQTADPERGYTVEYSVLCTNYRTLEQHIHKTFNNKHEWVSGELADIIAEIKSTSK